MVGDMEERGFFPGYGEVREERRETQRKRAGTGRTGERGKGCLDIIRWERSKTKVIRSIGRREVIHLIIEDNPCGGRDDQRAKVSVDCRGESYSVAVFV
jgi:hypothetical protein